MKQTQSELEKNTLDYLAIVKCNLSDSPKSFSLLKAEQIGFYKGICFVKDWGLNYAFLEKIEAIKVDIAE